MKTNRLESLKKYSIVVADSGDIESIARYKPQDATTNPSLLFKAAQDPRYRHLIELALNEAAGRGGDAAMVIDYLLVAFGSEILKVIPGRISTEVDPRLSFNTAGTIEKARHLVRLYADQGIGPERVLVKVASTWEGIRAAEQLEREGIHCNMTLLFSMAQAVASADAGVTLISPFVGRIYDWYCAAQKVQDIPINKDPGVASVTRIYNYYKKFGYRTQVMGASFRKVQQIERLAGCDLLTISPDLLEQLSAATGNVTCQLSPETAAASEEEKIALDEKDFRWLHNQDAMAVEKLSEGIRKFDEDARRLENYIARMAPE